MTEELLLQDDIGISA